MVIADAHLASTMSFNCIQMNRLTLNMYCDY